MNRASESSPAGDGMPARHAVLKDGKVTLAQDLGIGYVHIDRYEGQLLTAVLFAALLLNEVVFVRRHDDLADLDGLDWERIASDDWRDTPDDNDRKRRKQAEFLVHGFFPWQLVSEIGVYDSRVQERVVEILGKTEHKPPVNVRNGLQVNGKRGGQE